MQEHVSESDLEASKCFGNLHTSLFKSQHFKEMAKVSNITHFLPWDGWVVFHDLLIVCCLRSAGESFTYMET
jgi:hypothetical protein